MESSIRHCGIAHMVQLAAMISETERDSAEGCRFNVFQPSATKQPANEWLASGCRSNLKPLRSKIK